VLKELVPQLSRVAVLGDASTRDQLRVAEDTARRLALKLQPVELGAPPRDYDSAFRTPRAGNLQALLLLMSGTFFRDRAKLAALAREHRLPAIFGLVEYPEGGWPPFLRI
jgi:putative tryptophan/tyrosine transport system substrate-binding protein